MERGGDIAHHTGFFSDPESWVAIAFLIFVALFGVKLWRAVTSILDKRADAVRAELEEASRLRQEAEAMLAQARARRDQAMAEARHLLQSAHGEAERLTAEAHREADTVARRRERMAQDRIAAAEKAAVAELRGLAADIAVRATEAVLRQGLSPELDALIVDRAIAGLPFALTQRPAA